MRRCAMGIAHHGSRWKGALVLPGVPPRPYSIAARATDCAGNVSPESAVTITTIDTTPPAYLITAPPPDRVSILQRIEHHLHRHGERSARRRRGRRMVPERRQVHSSRD